MEVGREGARRQQSGKRSPGCFNLSSSAAEASKLVKGQAPLIEEATVGRGGATEDGWS